MVATARAVELEIESIGAGGDGVARHDGLVVFTPRTAPGDRVLAEVTVSGRVGRGTVVRVERAGGTRVDAICSHYAAPDRCGGCQWQHVDIAAQREAKRAMVRDAFKRIAKREVPLPAIVGGEPWRYRRTLSLAIRRRGDAHIAGLRAFDDPESVFSLDDCHITAEPVLEAWRVVLGAASALPDDARLRGTVRLVNGRAHFTLEGGSEWSRLNAFLEQTKSIAAIWWQKEGGRRRLVADRRPAGEPGASFAQVNPEIAARLHADVIARAKAHAPAKVIDAYSGAGDTAVRLAEHGAQVIAIEADEEATQFAADRLKALGTSASSATSAFKSPSSPSRAIAARVEDVIAKHLPADAVILNPPRAGVDAKVTTALATAAKKPAAILYVSCDPATLARDVARLPGYRIHELTCYDMFPQTAHVESLCELRPEDAP